MHATQQDPLRTYVAPRLGVAAIVTLAAAIAGTVVVVQAPWARSASPAAPTAEAVTRSLVDFRAGERAVTLQAESGPSGIAPRLGRRGLIAQ